MRSLPSPSRSYPWGRRGDRRSGSGWGNRSPGTLPGHGAPRSLGPSMWSYQRSYANSRSRLSFRAYKRANSWSIFRRAGARWSRRSRSATRSDIFLSPNLSDLAVKCTNSRSVTWTLFRYRGGRARDDGPHPPVPGRGSRPGRPRGARAPGEAPETKRRVLVRRPFWTTRAEPPLPPGAPLPAAPAPALESTRTLPAPTPTPTLLLHPRDLTLPFFHSLALSPLPRHPVQGPESHGDARPLGIGSKGLDGLQER